MIEKCKGGPLDRWREFPENIKAGRREMSSQTPENLVDILLEFKEDEPELFDKFRDTHEASFVKIEKLIRKKRVK